METAKKPVVVLFDDDQVDRRAIERKFPEKYSIVGVGTEADFRAAVETYRPSCLLIDYLIPSVNSLAVLEEFSERGLACILLTGEGSEKIAVEAMKAGAKDYLSKGELTTAALDRIIGSAIDRQLLEEELSERQQGIETFAHVASHDLNAPLCTIRQACMVIRDLYVEKLPAEMRPLVEMIDKSCATMSGLVDDLLQYSRLSKASLEPELLSMTELVQEVVDLAELEKRQFDSSITVHPLPDLRADRHAIQVLFQHLVDNAILHGGTPHAQVEIGGEENDKGTLFFVKDSGPGIAESDHNLIFLPFRRGIDATIQHSSGMGLATCQKIMNFHKGRIWVESEPDNGATFFMQFFKRAGS